MDLLEYTKEYCAKNGIKPTRSRGQNFLINDSVYEKIIDASELNKDDVVLEVGPGLGFLTRKLAEKAGKVLTVELDDKLFNLLEFNIKKEGQANLELINQNVLDFRVDNWEHRDKYKIVANLPYNITSVFLRKFLSSEYSPEFFVLMLQKEVAERIAAKPGKMSLLAVSVQFYAEAEILFNVGKEDFWPSPEVESAVIKIKVDKEKNKDIDVKKFFQLVKIGFSAKRKMLKKNLSAGLRIPADEVEEKIVSAGFDGRVRAQELSVDDWKKLLEYF
jgi:16S rRNA (adenine1518-N6/adenine1519-N6)-dimethyltransferase